MTQFPPKKTIHHATLLDVQASANEKDLGNSGGPGHSGPEN